MLAMAFWIDAVAAATPIGVILVAMVLFRQSAATAGVLGLVVAGGLAGFYFEFPELVQLDRPVITGFVGAFAEAGFTAVTILWIIFGALCLYHLQVETEAIDTLRDAVGDLSDDPRLVAILIAWFFALFMEGAAGFGTPVALAAPFLVGFGFPPVQAVTIAMIGHSVGVSFGAVGTPIIPQAAVTDWTGPEIARVTGEFHAVLGAIMLAAVLFVVSRRTREQRDAESAPIGRWFALAAVGFLFPMWALSRWLGPELPTMGGALVGGAIFVAVLRFTQTTEGAGNVQHGDSESDDISDETSTMSLWRAASPYLVVIGLILVTRLVEPIQALLQTVELQWELFGQFDGSFQPLYHPGTILVIGFTIGARLQNTSLQSFFRSIRKALKMLVPVTIALLAMLAISRLMVHTAMIDVLAGAAATTGALWPGFAPTVGVLGTFVTGSATASNILFTDFQVATATELNFDALRLVGAQGFGAAVGNIICPHNIIAGCATVGIAGREGDILRRTLGACFLYVTLGGMMAWILVG